MFEFVWEVKPSITTAEEIDEIMASGDVITELKASDVGALLFRCLPDIGRGPH